MKPSTTFTLHPQSTLLTPETSEMKDVLARLQLGRSIAVGAHNLAGAHDDQWLMVQTAGTTGAYKVIRRTPETWVKSFEVNRDAYGLTDKNVYATLGSLNHSLTLFATLEAFHLGADLCELATQGPKNQAKSIREHHVSVIYATPSQLRLLITGAQESETFPSIRHIFSGGGKLGSDLRDALQAACPNARICEFFGASETSFITISDATTPDGSVGRPYPNVELRIGSDETTEFVGEIWVASPYLFDGYAQGSSADTKWDGEFLSIGEMGYLDSDGYLFLKGRKNRMVTVADQNVFPEEIEERVCQMAGIESCAVIATLDVSRGHKLTCFVASRSGDVDLNALRNYCRSTLAPHAVPRDFVILQEMPLLAAGKPDLSKLRALVGKSS
jgi:long-chain acyl-CoA synthetase